MTISPFALTTYSRVDGYRPTEGGAHLAADRPWGKGMSCTDEYVPGRPDGVLVREITCKECLDALPGLWEVQVPDKRFKSGKRTLYTGFAHEAGATAAAKQSGRKGAKAVKISMRRLLEIEEESP